MAARKKQEPIPATITIVEAAKRLRIGRNQAYEAAHRREIPVIKIGNRLLVPTHALDRLLSGETNQPKLRKIGADDAV